MQKNKRLFDLEGYVFQDNIAAYQPRMANESKETFFCLDDKSILIEFTDEKTHINLYFHVLLKTAVLINSAEALRKTFFSIILDQPHSLFFFFFENFPKHFIITFL